MRATLDAGSTPVHGWPGTALLLSEIATGHTPAAAQALPDHLRRVEHRQEPESSAGPTPDCGRPMTRVGRDVSDRLVQEPANLQIIAGGIAASGFVAHTADQPLRRSPAVLPPGDPQRPVWRSPAPPDDGLAVWPRRCGDAAAVRRAPALRAELPGAARRRDAGGAAGPGRGQDQTGLQLGLRACRARCPARVGLCALPGARISAPDSLPGQGRRVH